MRYSGTPLQVTANSFQGKVCLRHSKSTILTAVSLNFYFFKYKVLFKGEWNLKTQAGMKMQIICKYFYLPASFGCSINVSTKERLAHKLFHTFATHRPCKWCHWHRLLGTKWQHALSCFCGFQASICFHDFQAVVLVKTGWESECQTAMCSKNLKQGWLLALLDMYVIIFHHCFVTCKRDLPPKFVLFELSY